jgi:hypothetical protein
MKTSLNYIPQRDINKGRTSNYIQFVQDWFNVQSYTITLFFFWCKYVFLFYHNNVFLILWSCTLCVLNFNLCVFVLVVLFYVLNLNLHLSFCHPSLKILCL